MRTPGAPQQDRSVGVGQGLLSLQLLGPFTVRRGDAPLPPLRSRQGQWVLALLILHRDRPVAREWLAATLWPDSAPEQALYNLRRNLTDIRQALGSEADRLASPTPRTLTLDLTDAACDVIAFETAVQSDDPIRWEEAVTLYAGPLLDGCREEWVLPERVRIQDLYLGVLERLAHRQPDLTQRIALLEKLTAIDTSRESAQRALMEAYAGAGDYASATQVYRRFRIYLQDAIGISPDAETVAAHQRLRVEARQRAGTTEPATASRLLPELPVGFEPGAQPIGREREIAEVAALLQQTRLVTLTGPGGIGKTRLALAVADAVSDRFESGIAFVDLSSVFDGTLVPQTVAGALGIREESGTPLMQTMTMTLQRRQLLLVLDNCEQILPACSRLVDALLPGATDLHVIATSRQILSLAAERAFPVPGLATPPAQKRLLPPQLLTYPAVRLFADRATAISPRFAITESNTDAIREICRSLDGMPLAIELAAARVRTLTPAEIAHHLGARLRLLTGGSRRAPQRQQTLRSLIDWSYGLLSRSEQIAFQRLAAFSGGWTLEQAEAVLADDRDGEKASLPATIERWEVLDLLTSLSEKSLIAVDEDDTGDTRYRMLETLRAYATEQAEAAGAAAHARTRHRALFLRLATEASDQLEGPSSAEWQDRLRRDHDNLRAAQDWALSDPDPAGLEDGLQFIRNLGRFWISGWYASEGRQRCEAVLERAAHLTHSANYSRALVTAGNMAYLQSDLPAARTFFQRSLAVAEQQNDLTTIPRALGSLGTVEQMTGNLEAAQQAFERSVNLLRNTRGDRKILATSLTCLASVANDRHDYAAAAAALEEAAALARETNAIGLLATVLGNLGVMYVPLSDPQRGLAMLQEAIALSRTSGSAYVLWPNLRQAGSVAAEVGDFALAETYLRESLEATFAAGSAQQSVLTLEVFAKLRSYQGRFREAGRLLGASEALRQRISTAKHHAAAERLANILETARKSGVSDTVILEAMDDGRPLSEAEVIAEVLSEPADDHAAA